MTWDEAMRRIAAGEDVEAVLDQMEHDRNVDFDRYLRHDLGRPDIADRHATKMREIANGIDGARSTWSALSHAQRRILTEAARHGGRLDRVGKEYRHGARHQPYMPTYVATIRNLCARDLLAWDGGAFDPEAVAVVTERGRFVLKHGEGERNGG